MGYMGMSAGEIRIIGLLEELLAELKQGNELMKKIVERLDLLYNQGVERE